uniref:Uncharacterized protein YbiU n=3 Tax=Talaromyces marneffei TaxID=37727 RepID=A0A093VJ09_TALMA
MRTATTTGTVQVQCLLPRKPTVPRLDQRFVEIKKSLVKPENKQKVIQSYAQICKTLKDEIDFIQKMGPKMVPEIDFNDVLLNDGKLLADFSDLVRERGCVVLRNVVPEEQARAWEQELLEYTRKHRNVGGYPHDNPQNWSLWWTRPQVQMRSNPRVLKAMKAVSGLWHINDKSLPLDFDSQVVYPDRFRIRYPSKDAEYTLPPHLDSGAIERWEDEENRASYEDIFTGNWQDWDAWTVDHRIGAKSDLYGIEAACSCWRSLQGWLSLSHTSTGEGTLRLLPSLKLSVAYMMLRPLFHDGEVFDDSQPTFPGARPGNTQFFPTKDFHPHLDLERSIVGIPPVKPGDYVFWHCDLVHEVDRFHPGKFNSSVSYNACNPLTPYNIHSLVGVRDAFRRAAPPKDFALYEYANEEENQHEDHGAKEDNVLTDDGRRTLGLLKFDENEEGLTEGQRKVRKLANEMLGFS